LVSLGEGTFPSGGVCDSGRPWRCGGGDGPRLVVTLADPDGSPSSSSSSSHSDAGRRSMYSGDSTARTASTKHTSFSVEEDLPMAIDEDEVHRARPLSRSALSESGAYVAVLLENENNVSLC